VDERIEDQASLHAIGSQKQIVAGRQGNRDLLLDDAGSVSDDLDCRIGTSCLASRDVDLQAS
jgi:hypothetical protein